MADPLDKPTLINRAMTLIGHVGPALDDESEQAEIADGIFDHVIDHIFGLHTWSFSRVTRALQRLDDNDFAIRTYAFGLPGDALGGPLAVYDALDPASLDTDYVVQDGKLYAHGQTRWADFQVIPPFESWPLPFVAAFTKALAADYAVPVASLEQREMALKQECYGKDWEQFNGGLFGRLVARDISAQPHKIDRLGHQLNSARVS